MAKIFADRVLETTTTTGTGPVTLAGAVTGYQALSDVMSNGDTADYAIIAVDGSGVPTGQWETGLGTYASGVLTRTTVHASSNSDAAVSFSAGTKRVQIGINAATVQGLSSGGSQPWYFDPPAAADFTLSNSGSIDITLVDDADLGLLFECPMNGPALQTSFALQNTPSGSWTATLRLDGEISPAEYNGFGLCLLDSASDKFFTFGWRYYTSYGYSMMVNKWTNRTTFNADSYIGNNYNVQQMPWRRIVYNSTTGMLYFQISFTGKSWKEVFREYASTFLPNFNKIGFFVGTNISIPFVQGAIQHFSVV